MSEKTYQAKLTEVELKAALITTALNIANSLDRPTGLQEEEVDRFNYLAKRLLKIQKGEPEINNETEQSENPAPSENKTTQGWA